jgi:hypothetical protein
VASVVNVYNMALGHLGSSGTIASTTEKSTEAHVCNTFWESTLNATLRDFRIPEAIRFKTLSLVEEDPTEEWGYSYDYPNDVLSVRRILSGIRNDSNDSRVPYRQAQDSNSRQLIYTDAADAVAECSMKVTNLSLLPDDVILALSLRLASYIAPVITKGDPFKLGIRSFQLYSVHVTRANANSLNSQQPDQPPQSDHVRSRT